MFDPCDYVICDIRPLAIVIGVIVIAVGILLWWSERTKKTPCNK